MNSHSLFKILKGLFKIQIELLDEKGIIVGFGSSELMSSISSDWKQVEFSLASSETVLNGNLNVSFEGKAK